MGFQGLVNMELSSQTFFAHRSWGLKRSNAVVIRRWIDVVVCQGINHQYTTSSWWFQPILYSQIGFLKVGATIRNVRKPPPRYYGFYHGILYHQQCVGSHISLHHPSAINLKGHQQTPGTYPRPPKQQFMFRNSFLLRVWGCLGYV